jgi:hypothetical protein
LVYPKPSLPEYQFYLRRDANRVEEADLLDRLGKGFEITHVLAMTRADLDLTDLDFNHVVHIHGSLENWNLD